MNRIFDKGVALLEFAAGSVILISLLIGGVGLAQYVRIKRQVSQIIDNVLYNTSVKPYKVQMANGDFRILLNTEQLTRFVNESVIKARTELENAFPNQVSIDQYLIRIAVSEVGVDSLSGQLQGFRPVPLSTLTYGRLSTSSDKDLFHGYDTGGVVLPTPSGLFLQPGAPKYLPGVVLVGLSIEIDPSITGLGGFTKNILQLSRVFEGRVSMLRGGVG